MQMRPMQQSTWQRRPGVIAGRPGAERATRLATARATRLATARATRLATALAAGLAAAALAPGGLRAADPLVGNLADFSGRTAAVSTPYSRAKMDAVAWYNAHGGVGGKPIDLQTVDYAYEVPRAIIAYKEWTEKGVVAVQGWGTADTEALVGFVSEDKVPYFSASYSARLTDPQGRGPDTRKPTPYNFIMGPSYSDSLRALLDWAKADWAQKGRSGAPKFVFMGDNHPYPNAPRRAGETYAKELGFDVLAPIQYSLAPGDFHAQCLELRQVGADYAYLANTSDSNVALLTACATEKPATQFMANIWGYDENVMKAAGRAADGVVWVMGAQPWTAETPGIQRVHEIARAANPDVAYQPVHYVRGVCAVAFMKEAMDWAAANGGITGPNIKTGMYQKQDWVPDGLDGACAKATWSAEDHRGFTQVLIFRGSVTADPPADASIADLVANGVIGMRQVFVADVARKQEWLGW